MPSKASAPCASRSRFVTKALAVQRGLDTGVRHREEVVAKRFAVSPGRKVCTKPSPDYSGRTACYAEHSKRRKTCPLLSYDDNTVPLHKPGIYLVGLPPYEEPDDEEDEPFNTMIIGPYPVGKLQLVVKRVELDVVFGNHKYPENVSIRFYGRDMTIPSIDELRDFVGRMEKTQLPDSARRCITNARECVSMLLERRDTLRLLQRRCNRDPVLQRAARRVLQNIFYFAMYSRRWAGPGTPYPIQTKETNRNVGQNKVISEHLRGMAVNVSSTGEVLVRDRNWRAADEIQYGKAMAMVEAHLLGASIAFDSAPSVLKSCMLAADRWQTTDGDYWPKQFTLFEIMFDESSSVSSYDPKKGKVCTRQVSSDLIRTCEMLASFLYKTRPQWLVYEGKLDEIQ